jgi:Ser/Thr protein kinase RdoA (MazF antagonist)
MHPYTGNMFSILRTLFFNKKREYQGLIEEFWPLRHVRIHNYFHEKGGRKVFSIKSIEGKFLVKMAASSKSVESIKSDTFVLAFLKKLGFEHAPLILKTRNGTFFHQIKNQFMHITEFIEGKSPKSTEDNWHKLGIITANLHNIEGYPYSSLFTFDSVMPELFENVKMFKFGKEYLYLVNTLPDFKDLPISLIHTDIGLHNAVMKHDGNLVLVDWDDSGTGPTVIDLGFPLICQFISSHLKFRKSIAESFYQGYLSRRQITDKEKNIIFNSGLFCALMYIKYGIVHINWRKIQYAIRNKEMITSVLNG